MGNARFTIKRVELWLILIVNLKNMDTEALVLMGMVALVTRVPMIAMEDLVQHLNTSAREHPKPNAIRLHAPFHLNIVKIRGGSLRKINRKSSSTQGKAS